MPGARLSPLRPEPSEHAFETWVFVKPVASPAVCTSKVTDDMFIRYTIKLLQLVTFISHKVPLSIFAIFKCPHVGVTVASRNATSGWAGTHIAESLINGTQCVCVSAIWFLASQYLLAHLRPPSSSCGA
jgi:hypothetical protein